ncbi:MAG TPA: DNA polymerase III subunit beta [Polyangia bacterium]|jgi:DNA polymerase III subunit beta|nr:DNA polymerase III subunit beta [Polyangia bacterium]
MEFKIRKDEFLRGLYLAQGIADRKSTLPILANVLLRTDGKDKLLCGATDLNVSTQVTLAAKIEKEGGLTVAARQLYEIVKGLPDDEVRVKRTEQNWAEIKSGKVEFKVVGVSDRDYPKLPAIAEAQTFSVETAALRDMIAKTIFSVSLDETRQHLAGVLFESDGSTARMVSTDGHRLSKAARALPGGPKLATGVLIPRKGIVELRRAIETRDTPTAIGIHDGNFVLKADDVGISVKLIEGQFPPYEQVIPKDNERAFVLPRLTFLDALRRVSLMSSDKTSGVRFGLDKGKLRIESDNPDLGAAREEIDIAYKGTPVQIGFNARYFIDLLAEVETPDVRVELAGELDPAVVRPSDGSDYVCVVMPMRL